jgi:hypothetical protein
VTGLLPHAVREAVERKSLFAASTSFGVVALIVLVALLLEWQGLEIRSDPRRVAGFSAIVLPLLVAVVLTIAARLAHILA